MKTLLLTAALLLTSTSFAQLSTTEGDKYREFTVQIKSKSGESKTVYLSVDEKTNDYSYGDADIPGHGFYESEIKGQVSEGTKTCNFNSLYSQTDDGDTRKFNTVVKLCSGLSLVLSSADDLLQNKNSVASVITNGLTESIGTATIKFDGLKIIEAIDYDRY